MKERSLCIIPVLCGLPTCGQFFARAFRFDRAASLQFPGKKDEEKHTEDEEVCLAAVRPTANESFPSCQPTQVGEL